MFGLGLWEIGVIALAIVVLVKPSELPRAARAVGRVIRRIQNFSTRASAEMRQLSVAMDLDTTEQVVEKPSDDEIRPLQTQEPSEADGNAQHGYSGAASGDATER